jgi:hypothetical protein
MNDQIVPTSTAVVPMGGDDDLALIAANAEKRIDAVNKIKRIALKVTNAMDWVDQRDKPYLMASGAEKIAGLFNISWVLLTPEPVLEVESDGNYTYTYAGQFTMGSRSIQCEGSRSSRDKFFTQYEYDGKAKKEKLVGERDNKRDVKMAAFTNLLGNGITRILGIRNLTYADLQEFAGISKDQLQKVEYKTGPKADPPATPTTDQAQAPKNDAPKSAPKQDDGGDVFDTLENELYDFCRGDAAAMQEKLQELTAFPGKDKDTGEPTGKMVPGKRFVSDLREKGKTAWAGSALKKLRSEVGR